jgi:phenylpyruvate tautomerase PptA (4-oxalocrotonate tautomerase family)
MPMIDLYVPAATFADVHDVAARAAAIVKNIEQVPDIPMFRNNTAAFVHELSPAAISDASGAGDHARVQVLTNAGALDREKQLAVVTALSDLVVEASDGRMPAERIWVLLTEATPGGWGLWGHAHTNDELVAAARAEIGRLKAGG